MPEDTRLLRLIWSIPVQRHVPEPLTLEVRVGARLQCLIEVLDDSELAEGDVQEVSSLLVTSNGIINGDLITDEREAFLVLRPAVDSRRSCRDCAFGVDGSWR